ncbi:hypothetical protein [Pseudomonas syringae]|uniref:hypothetical protein n=1 Tax=Pseudomonas syringae TaxID=317 RepID=UPI000BB5B723|nr:hypothetical protein [Pseudomonas syringae]PBP53310.1 hypothetical protein CCL10_18120 [Pseudomonas syringae]
MIKWLTREQHSALMRAQWSLTKAQGWAVETQETLQSYFSEVQTKAALGVSFVAGEVLGAEISTLFGNGRAVAVNAIVSDRVMVRYIFEKAVSFENGTLGHVKVAEIRIDAEGVITDDGGQKLADLNSLHDSESSGAVKEIGLSVIHALCSNEHYCVVV